MSSPHLSAWPALIHSMLRAKGLTRKVTVPVSAGLLADTRAYFETLTRYREGEIAPIVETMANASLRAIDNGRRLVGELRGIRQGWTETVKARRDSTAWKLADLLMRQPVVDSAAVVDELGIRQANALRPINVLVDAGAHRVHWLQAEQDVAVTRGHRRAGRVRRAGRPERLSPLATCWWLIARLLQ